MLVKPGRTFDESRDGFLCQRETLRAEMIAKEIEPFLDPADEGLIRVGMTAPGLPGRPGHVLATSGIAPTPDIQMPMSDFDPITAA